MKNILTITLIFFSFQGFSQVTLEQLQLRLQIVENSTMTLPQFNLCMDSIAFRRDSILRNNIQGWMNNVRRIMEDSFNVRLARARVDVWRLDSTRVAQNAAIQATNVNYISLVQIQMNLLQTQIRNLLNEIEAIKLRIANFIKALNTIQ